VRLQQRLLQTRLQKHQLIHQQKLQQIHQQKLQQIHQR
jgi:hypothetical protein